MTIESPGDELSYLLFKHPGRVQGFDLAVGRATVFYPRADERSTKAALLVDADPAVLAKSKGFKVDGFELAHHINDRAYAASSLLAVAMGRVFRSALAGSDPEDRPGAAARARDLVIHLPSARSRGGVSLVRDLFEPLGWDVRASESVPTCVDLTLRGNMTLSRALSQLYVLLPVLDNSKHYWVGEAEIEKLVRAGEGWLPEHPARELIMARYLAHQRGYVADAVSRLAEDAPGPEEDTEERPWRMGAQRVEYLAAKLAELGASRVLDLGCGEGWLVRRLLDSPGVEVVGADVSAGALDQAARRLDGLPERQRERASLIQASATYRDRRFAGFDAVVAAEVVEHLDPYPLAAFERTVFADARPKYVLMTTPNAEYNQVYGLDGGELRHHDHRFEWTRAEFREWANGTGQRAGYEVSFEGIGPADDALGQPTQAAVFRQQTPRDSAAPQAKETPR
ncbi:MAG: 3' terminal RNA ribose 2'-O-methyltransferase Hen1 [Bifidobacteriaceae bacterium]|jgi:3' terminal RNA ribose 2'-O-methyltransferase Hen1|nr:3' terminal RNA ribose 2'-O-methyltransferase Hen1 [Bifidobacteriaceae bacterium]